MAAKDTRVVFVTREGLGIYPSPKGGVVSLSFDPKMVSDLEVLNATALETQIGRLIDQQQLTPGETIFVFASWICFWEDVKETDPIKKEALIRDFTAALPFESTLVKVYPTAAGERVVAINAGLYRALSTAFEKKGFVSQAVVPALVLGDDLAKANALTKDLAQAVLDKIEAAHAQSFLTVAETPVPIATPQEVAKSTPSHRRRMIVLGFIFALGVLVLVGLLVWRSTTP